MYGLEKETKWKQLIIDRAHKHTDGREFCLTDLDVQSTIATYSEVHYCKCDYCGKEILAVWDGFNADNYWPYLGVQSKRLNSYTYSPIIQIMRKNYELKGLDWKDNNLLNSHTRVHSDSWDMSIRMSENALRFLCNDCFQKTYNRYQVRGNNGILYALSVVEDRGETIESVMKDLNIEGEVIGKGAISEY